MPKKMGIAVEAAVAATLQTNINAELNAIWVAWNDTQTIPEVYPRHIYAGYRELIPEYPAIVVTSVSGRQPENAAPYWARVDHRIDIAVVCQSDDVHVLDQQVKRYLVAIWEVIMKNQGLDGSLSGLSGVDLSDYGRSEIYRLDKSKLLMQSAGWTAVVHVDESV